MLSLQMLPMSAPHLLLNAIVLWHHGNAMKNLTATAVSWIILDLVNAKVSACATMPMPAG